ncbi:hypothetical protein GCM10025298_21300 [Natronobiforma cellulositropha]
MALALVVVLACALALGSTAATPATAPAATSATQPIDGCAVIDESGTYELTVNATTNATCLEITASDVHVEGNGHVIAGADLDASAAAGIAVTDAANVTVRNVTVTGWGAGENETVERAGIAVENVTDGTLESVHALENDVGLSLADSPGATLTDVAVRESAGWDVRLEASATAIDGLALENATVSLEAATLAVRSTPVPEPVPAGNAPVGFLDVDAPPAAVHAISLAYDPDAVSRPGDLAVVTAAASTAATDADTWVPNDAVAFAADTAASSVTTTVTGSATLGVVTSDPIPVDDCRDLDAPGVYELTEPIGGSETCLEITADDVTLDGAGYSVGGRERPGADQHGVRAVNVSNATVRDLLVGGWGVRDEGRLEQAAGVSFENVTGGVIEDVRAIQNEQGVSLVDSRSVVVREIDTADNFAGVALWHSSENTVTDVEATGNVDGVWLWRSERNAFGSVAISDAYYGVATVRSDGNRFVDTTVTDATHGHFLLSADANAVVNTTITDADRGVVFDGSSHNLLTESTVSGGETAVVLRAESNANAVTASVLADTLEGVVVRGGSNETAITGTAVDATTNTVAVADAVGTAMTDLEVGGETLSFDAENVSVASVPLESAPALTPESHAPVGAPLTVEATGAEPYLALTLTYANASLGDAVDAETLGLWRADDGAESWSRVADSSAEPANRTVSATLTEGGVVGVFGLETYPLEVSLVDARGEPVTNATTVTVADAETGGIRAIETATDASASFALQNGTYELLADAPGTDTASAAVTVDGDATAVTVELPALETDAD